MQYDAVIVGSGPNGIAAAIHLQQKGLSTCIIEGDTDYGGGMRTKEILQAGYKSDICSAVHPMFMTSPFFQSLPLAQFGLSFINPPVLAAHPLDNGENILLHQSLEKTIQSLGEDGRHYHSWMQSLMNDWPAIVEDVLAPFHFPMSPLKMASFGGKAIQSANYFAKRFKTEKGRALWSGMAAHSLLPLHTRGTAAIGISLLVNAHIGGWPIPVGGSQSIADALVKYYIHIGGKIETGKWIKSLSDIPSSKSILLDITPQQLLEIADFSEFPRYKKQLSTYQYGAGVFKMDWILDHPVPFINDACRNAGTIHIGGNMEEIINSEKMIAEGKISNKPFVILAQQSVFDPSRTPNDHHVLWGYCHVPNGSTADCTEIIEAQIERFAPGFKKSIIKRNTMHTKQMQDYNPNYIGGDINGGKLLLQQLFFKPFYRKSPYITPLKNVYICSSSTPPGGGVHGMCGYHAAQQVLKHMENSGR